MAQVLLRWKENRKLTARMNEWMNELCRNWSAKYQTKGDFACEHMEMNVRDIRLNMNEKRKERLIEGQERDVKCVDTTWQTRKNNTWNV